MLDKFITLVQARLNAHGFQVAEDGLFSGGTRLALRAFQKVAGLQATGTVLSLIHI